MAEWSGGQAGDAVAKPNHVKQHTSAHHSAQLATLHPSWMHWPAVLGVQPKMLCEWWMGWWGQGKTSYHNSSEGKLEAVNVCSGFLLLLLGSSEAGAAGYHHAPSASPGIADCRVHTRARGSAAVAVTAGLRGRGGHAAQQSGRRGVEYAAAGQGQMACRQCICKKL